MASAKSSRGTRGGKARRPKAPRPALGNDPFERGAAPREESETPTTATPTPTSATPTAAIPTSTPTETSAVASRAVSTAAEGAAAATARIAATEERVQDLAARAEQRVTSVATRLGELAAEEAAGKHARDLLQLLGGMRPALGDALSALAVLRRLFDGPGPHDEHGMDAELVARARPALDFLADVWFRVEVGGLDRLPAGPAIIVANHGGRFHWDAVLLAHLLRRAGRELRPLLDQHALSPWLLGRAATRLGGVPATAENALRLLASGSIVAVFPEGSRNGERPWPERYRIRRFGRGGFARVAIRAAVPVVPCAIVGSEEAAAPLARTGWFAEALGLPLLGGAPGVPVGPLAALPLPSRWSVRFGEPILPPPAAASEDPAEVNALAERTRGALQGMLDEDVASRRSVYL